MSQKTRDEILTQLRQRYLNAGREHKSKLIDQAVDRLGDEHRKSALRALRRKKPSRLLEPLKTIWLTDLQPCGRRLEAMLPQRVAAYEADQKPLESEVRERLLEAKLATLERWLAPLRCQCPRRRPAPPGTLLRHEIPIRTQWNNEGPGYLEIDTVALCGGILDDRHLWMFN